MNIQNINKPIELLNLENGDSPYVFSNFIKNERMGERRDSKKKLKLLKVVDPMVRKMLDEDETVIYITSGLKVSGFEQMFIGWVVYYYNISAFIFTSKRILLIHMKSEKKLGDYLGCIEYSDIKEIKSGLLGGFYLKLINGKSLSFSKVSKRDRVYIRDFVNSVVDRKANKNKSAKGIRNLCPECLVEVPGHPDECAGCQLAFKKPRLAALLSLLMPGLGDLYLGSRFLGGIELLVMIIIWSSIISGYTPDAVGEFIVGCLVVFLIVHPIDALKAYYIGKKGLIPAK